jgi:hypothetical protein
MPGSLPDERILHLTGWRLQEHSAMIARPEWGWWRVSGRAASPLC